ARARSSCPATRAWRLNSKRAAIRCWAMRPDIMSIAATPFLDSLAGPRNAAEPGWLTASRDAARARFAETGFPTRRHEAWRFTELKSLTETRFAPAPALVGDATILGERLCRLLTHAHRLVFVNGRFDADHSHIGALPEGVYLGSFAAWVEAHGGEAAKLFAE